MLLKSQVEWALHCCSVLASLPEGATLATKDLAELHGIPKEYLGKALQALSQAGIVAGSLGPRGGYRLAKAPAAVSFLAVVEAVEGRGSTFACTEIRLNNPCVKGRRTGGRACAVARVMQRADQAWRRELAGTTLADLLEQLRTELDPALRERTAAWLAARTGGGSAS
jgi:Rrf2 family protein